MTTAAGYWDAAQAATWIAYGEARGAREGDDEAPEIQAALGVLVAAVETCDLPAEGFPCGADWDEPTGGIELISPGVFATRDRRADTTKGNLARTITLDSRIAPPLVGGVTAMEDIMRRTARGGSYFLNVRFQAARVRELWPRHDTASATPPEAEPSSLPFLRTGAAGRPSSMHLIRREHNRRIEAGEAHIALASEARHLADWLRRTHPEWPPPGAKAIEEPIREAHRIYRNRKFAPPLKSSAPTDFRALFRGSACPHLRSHSVPPRDARRS